MKQILCPILGLLFFCSIAGAVEFRFDVEPKHNGNGLIGKNSEILLYMNNNDGVQRNAYSMTLVFYSPHVNSNIWLNADSAGIPPSLGAFRLPGECLEIHNGFYPAFFAGDRFTTLNFVDISAWNNVSPDTVNHTVLQEGPGSRGWAPDEGELLVYSWHVRIENQGPSLPYANICIDSSDHFNPELNWIWTPPSGPFGGQHCIRFDYCHCTGLWFENCQETDLYGYPGIEFSKVFTTNYSDALEPVNEADASIGNTSILNDSQVVWTYTPTAEDIGVVDIELCGAPWFYSCPTSGNCQFQLIVVESPPCADVNDDDAVDLLDILYLIDYIYGDPPGPGPVNPEYGDFDGTGDVNLVDILILTDFIYGDPSISSPQCP